MEDEHTASSSVGTLRGAPLHLTISPPDITDLTSPRAASPHSSLPSPSSPSGDSVSSFPSVSSSFLFSSGPATPPQIDLDIPGHPPESESGHELIIPSLTLPSPIRRATQYGKTLGDVKLLVLSRAGANAEEFLRVLADEQCEDYVDVGTWENLTDHQNSRGNIHRLNISTDWIEHSDRHGLEKYEPAKNIEVTQLPDYDLDDDPDELLGSILERVHDPFQSMLSLVNFDQPPNPLLAQLLASPSSPLYTALLLLLPSSLTPFDYQVISELSLHVPLIIFPSSALDTLRLHSHPRSSGTLHLSLFHPDSPHAFRTTLIHSPETLASLRLEAVDRFLRWREVERGVERVLDANSGIYPSTCAHLQTPRRERHAWDWETHDSPHSTIAGSGSGAASTRGKATVKWDKAHWESKWQGSLSTDVAKGLRRRRESVRGREVRPRQMAERRSTVTSPSSIRPSRPSPPQRLPSALTKRSSPPLRHQSPHDSSEKDVLPPPSMSFDPLHLPSLFAFSLSLFAPLRTRFFNSLPLGSRGDDPNGSVGLGVGIILGAFCAGFGIGYIIAGM
ncbi:unnamed protein product [Somion occarium]|uniref:BRCT domain-containing protein n=1 Tax=Somion occarium TaxID=3059160 RepID=A0ABP1DQK6_9APHY